MRAAISAEAIVSDGHSSKRPLALHFQCPFLAGRPIETRSFLSLILYITIKRAHHLGVYLNQRIVLRRIPYDTHVIWVVIDFSLVYFKHYVETVAYMPLIAVHIMNISDFNLRE